MEFLKHPWPWWVAGPLIGLMVPALLLLGNKTLGISSTLRHICAAVFPANISYFKYDWKKESWNLVFVCGILLGSWFAAQGIGNPNPIVVAPNLSEDLNRLGIHPAMALAPAEIFSWSQLFTARSFLMIVGAASSLALAPGMPEDVHLAIPSWDSPTCNGPRLWRRFALWPADLLWPILFCLISSPSNRQL